MAIWFKCDSCETFELRTPTGSGLGGTTGTCPVCGGGSRYHPAAPPPGAATLLPSHLQALADVKTAQPGDDPTVLISGLAEKNQAPRGLRASAETRQIVGMQADSVRAAVAGSGQSEPQPWAGDTRRMAGDARAPIPADGTAQVPRSAPVGPGAGTARTTPLPAFASIPVVPRSGAHPAALPGSPPAGPGGVAGTLELPAASSASPGEFSDRPLTGARVTPIPGGQAGPGPITARTTPRPGGSEGGRPGSLAFAATDAVPALPLESPPSAAAASVAGSSGSHHAAATMLATVPAGTEDAWKVAAQAWQTTGDFGAPGGARASGSVPVARANGVGAVAESRSDGVAVRIANSDEATAEREPVSQGGADATPEVTRTDGQSAWATAPMQAAPPTPSIPLEAIAAMPPQPAAPASSTRNTVIALVFVGLGFFSVLGILIAMLRM